ncbi:MAG: TetR/AcrR family transcriptional regulator [Clostridia bacterium]|nr:TetR/AcrR family transcriptional regulator [Clostridia bacterium]
MKTVKNPEERKNEILDVAQELFVTKGFEHTAVSDIVKKVGVSQGTFYYYFKSKDDILTAILQRYAESISSTITKVVEDRQISPQNKLQFIINEFYIFEKGKENIVQYVHREENSEMHQRIAEQIIKSLIPLIAIVVKEGVEKGVFNTDYPNETAEILLPGIGQYIHNSISLCGDEAKCGRKLEVMTNIIEKVLGAKSGLLKF